MEEQQLIKPRTSNKNIFLMSLFIVVLFSTIFFAYDSYQNKNLQPGGLSTEEPVAPEQEQKELDSISSVVSPEGGSIELGDMVVDFPAMFFEAPTEVEIRKVRDTSIFGDFVHSAGLYSVKTMYDYPIQIFVGASAPKGDSFKVTFSPNEDFAFLPKEKLRLFAQIFESGGMEVLDNFRPIEEKWDPITGTLEAKILSSWLTNLRYADGLFGTNLVLATTLNTTGYESKAVTCVNGLKYIVINNTTLVDFSYTLVKYKSSGNKNITCEYVVQATDFEIKNEWAEYFLGLTGDFLIQDSGTSPGRRLFSVYDLKKRAKVYSGVYGNENVVIKDGILDYWEYTAEKPNEQNCPKLSEYLNTAGGAVIETHIELNLTDLTKKRLEADRCVAIQ